MAIKSIIQHCVLKTWLYVSGIKTTFMVVSPQIGDFPVNFFDKFLSHLSLIILYSPHDFVFSPIAPPCQKIHTPIHTENASDKLKNRTTHPKQLNTSARYASY